MRIKRAAGALFAIASALLLAGCETTYFNAMEKLGVHKREILIERIEDARQAQQDGQQQFSDALEQFKAVVNVDGGELQQRYDLLSAEFSDSEEAAEEISQRIDKVESVALALFEEWDAELDQYTSDKLKRDSQRQLKETRAKYQRLIGAMRKAEKSIDPVLNSLRDNVLYLKHNLNARAISSLRGELNTVNSDVSKLLQAMQQSISESDRFIQQLQGSQ